jgi:dephospho-CoA kinase
MQSQLKLIGVAGTAGAGKDTAAQILCQLFSMQNLSSGDMVRAITRQVYHLQPNFNPVRDQLYEVANYVRADIHPAAFVKLCILEAKALNIPRVVISGLRSMGEAQAVREAGGIIVVIDADPKIRYDRIFARARDAESQKSLEEFLEQDEFEKRGVSNQGPGRGIQAIMDSADLIIANNGTPEELTSQLQATVAPLILQ